MPTRSLMPDYLRLFALFGIVLVNVGHMAFPLLDGPPDAETAADAATALIVNGLAYLKTYGLFSFMFGVGLGFQIRSAERRGLPFGTLYRNRMIGLVLLGVAHGCLFFPGDILTIYAITGSILYFWRDWPVKRLVRVGIVLLALQIILASALAAVTPDIDESILEIEALIMTQGSFFDTAMLRAPFFGFLLLWGLPFQAISALGWFCLGLAALRSGLIDTPDHPLWVRARRFCLVPGVLLGLTAAAVWVWIDPNLGHVLVIVFAPVATIGYLGLIAALARPPGPFMATVLRAGGSSLSIYLGQSILLSTVFSAYGLGLWGEVSHLGAILTAIATTVLLIAALALWRTRFALGPFEWVLRGITRMGVKARVAA